MRCSIEEVVALRAATLEDGLIVPPKWFVTTENTELHVKVRTRPVETGKGDRISLPAFKSLFACVYSGCGLDFDALEHESIHI